MSEEKKTSRFGRLLESRKGKTLAVSVVVVGAFSLGMASTAVAANGMPFTLGRENVAKAVTTLTKEGPGAALNLVVRDGEPPMRVNSDGRVVNLNADKVDGLDASQLRGRTGPEGEQGPQGEQGETGEQGEQGDPGTDGDSVLSGTGAPDEDIGTVGDFYLDTAASELYGPKTADGWGDPVSLVGPQGIQGVQGETGEQGEQGEQGDEGPQGPQGEQGGTGSQGEQGEQGEQGLQGEQGIQGETGEQGEQGIQGEQGEQGDPGTDGNSVLSGEGPPAADFGRIGDFYIDVQNDEIYGPKSAEGWDDPTSLVGPQGAQGNQGIQGVQGETGPRGETGLQGETGPQGEQGDPGPQGEQGEQGPAGPTGTGTSENTPNSIVERDANGNFSAGTISANLNGVATNATNAQNAANAANANNAQQLQGQGPGAFLPSERFGNEWHTKGEGGINNAGNDSCYIGEVKLFAGNFPPNGTAFADGQILPINQYSALYSILGTRYGGNGTTNFQLPDMYGLGPDGVSYVICVFGIFPSRP